MVALVALAFDIDPGMTPALCEDLATLWVDVSNAGGSVGFVPPVTVADVRPALRKYLRGMAEGTTRLLVGRDDEGRVAATAFLVRDDHRLMQHWVWLYIVMVRPSLQGRGTSLQRGRWLPRPCRSRGRGGGGRAGRLRPWR